MEKELADKYNLGTSLDRELYNKIDLLLTDWQKELDFEVAGSGLGGHDFSIDFSIVTPKEKGLPEKISDLFFNQLDMNYSVKCEETDLYKDRGERHFQFELRPK